MLSRQRRAPGRGSHRSSEIVRNASRGTRPPPARSASGFRHRDYKWEPTRYQGPPGLFLPSSSAELLSAEEIRLATARFPAASSTDESTPPRPRGTLRTVSFDERLHEFMKRTSIEDELPDEETDFPPEEPSDDDDEENSGEGEDESEEMLPTDPDSPERQAPQTDEQAGPYEAFNKFASQILDQLEQSEQRSISLEQQLMTFREGARANDSPQQGYRPLLQAPSVSLDRESQNLLLMTPHDYKFPVPTRVTDITGKRKANTRPGAGPNPRNTEMFDQPTLSSPTATQGSNRPTAAADHHSPWETVQPASKLWDAWDMHSRARPSQPPREQDPGLTADCQSALPGESGRLT